MIDDGELGKIGYVRMRVGMMARLRLIIIPRLVAGAFLQCERSGRRGTDRSGRAPAVSHPVFRWHASLVSAQYGYFTGRDVEDHAVVAMRFASDALAVAEVSFIDNPGTFEIEVHGTKGIIRYAAPKRKLVHRPGNARGDAAIDPVVIDEPNDLPSAFEELLRAFSRNGKRRKTLRLRLISPGWPRRQIAPREKARSYRSSESIGTRFEWVLH